MKDLNMYFVVFEPGLNSDLDWVWIFPTIVNNGKII